MSDLSYAEFDPVAILGKMQEEQKRKEKENQMRYIPRKEEKIEHRRRLERTAMKICDLIDCAAERPPEDFKPEEITALAAALNNIAIGMHSADNYAEYQPPNTSSWPV